jgi:hypothetical protein
MGNFSSADISDASSPSEETQDLRSKIQSISLFNDAFVTSLSDKLPSYGFEEGNEDGELKKGVSSLPDDQKIRFNQLMKIFSESKGANSAIEKVEDHPMLTVEKLCGFEVMRQRRTKILIQLFKNYYQNEITVLKKTYDAKKSLSSSSEGTVYWRLPAVRASGSTTSSTLSSVLSVGMTLTIAKAVSVENPILLKTLIDFVLEALLSKQVDVSKSVGNDFLETTKLIWQFASDFFRSSLTSKDVRSSSFSVLLGIALTTGSVGKIVELASYLLNDTGGNLVLDSRVHSLIHRCCDIMPKFDLVPPNNKGNVEKFFFALTDTSSSSSGPHHSSKWSRNKAHSISMTVSKNYIYFFDGSTYSLAKIGSGEADTIPGEVLITKSDVYKSLKEMKHALGTEVLSPSSAEASSNGKDSQFITFSTRNKSSSIILSSNKIEARRPSRAGKKYCSIALDLQLPLPVPSLSAEVLQDLTGHAYFEVKMVNLPESQICGIGMIDLKRYQLDGSRMIGWDSGSYGFHSDDGLIYGENKIEGLRWLPWAQGDVIGCGIDYARGFIFYTHNGSLLGDAFNLRLAPSNETAIPSKHLIPCVTMKGERIEVKVNTGQESFLFENEALAKGSMKVSYSLSAAASSENDVEHPIANSSITVIDQRIFVRLDVLLQSYEIAVFDTNTLDLLEIRNMSGLFQSSLASASEKGSKRQANDASLISGLSLETFEISLSEASSDRQSPQLLSSEVLIRAAKGTSFELASAVVDDKHDVTHLLLSCVNGCQTSFYHSDIAEAIKGSLGRNEEKPQKLLLSFKSVQLSTRQRFCLPITSCGNDLIMLRTSFEPATKGKRAYDILQDVILTSVSDGKHDEPQHVSSYKEMVVKQWKQYLVTLHSLSSSSTFAASHDSTIIASSEELVELNREASNEFQTLYHTIAENDSDSEENDDEEDSSVETDEDGEERRKAKKEKSFSLSVTFKIGSHGSPRTVLFTSKQYDWNRVLETVEDHYSAGSDLYSLNVIDVANGFEVVSCLSLKTPEKSRLKEVDNSSLLYNGYQLLIIHPEFVDTTSETPEQLLNKTWIFSTAKSSEGDESTVDTAAEGNSAVMKSFQKKRFTKQPSGLPVYLTYDCNKNLIWSYDPINKMVLKWKNIGLAPVNVEAYSRSKGPLFEHPSCRLRHLRENISSLSSQHLGAMLLLLLEKLSEPYLGQINAYASSTAMSSNRKDVENYHKIRMTAKAYDSPTLGDQRCSLIIQNIPIYFDDEEHDDHSGYHVAVIDSVSHVVIKTRTFDNEDDEFSVHRMVEFIDDLSDGQIVCVLNTNCVHDSMNEAAYEALMKIGFEDIETEDDAATLLAIGIKGLQSSEADCILGKRNEMISIQRNLPVAFVPFQLEPAKSTISVLLDFCIELFEKINTFPSFPLVSSLSSDDNEIISSFASTLRVLTCNLFNIISRVSPTNRMQLVSSDQLKRLETFLLNLVVSPFTEFCSAIGTTALSLFSVIFDFIRPNKLDKLALLQHYASKYSSKQCSNAEIAFLEILLNTLSDATMFIEISEEECSSNSQPLFAFDLAFTLVNMCVCIIREEQTKNFQTSNTFSSSDIMFSCMNMLNSVCKLCISCDYESTAKSIISSTVASTQPLTALKILLLVSNLANDFLQSFLDCKLPDNRNHVTVSRFLLPLETLSIIQQSVVGSSLPVILMSVTEIIRNGGFKLINNCMETVLLLINQLLSTLQSINAVLSMLPSEANEYTDVVPSKQSTSKVYESEHPYRSNMDEKISISFPGASSVSISFDPATRTEHSCDYIQFLDKNGDVLHEDMTDKFSGRDGSEVSRRFLPSPTSLFLFLELPRIRRQRSFNYFYK